ncbi:hypothetical protein ACOSQ2_016397 [Xanthoceras sorbifolium]
MDYLFESSRKSRRSLLVSPGDSLHNKCLLFFEQRPLSVFESTYFVMEKKHMISYDNWIDSRHMFPERTQRFLPLELLVFHLTYFLLNYLKSVKDIHGYSKLFLACF